MARTYSLMLGPAAGAPEFVLGQTKPDTSNTGVQAGVSLTTVSGNVTLSTPGQVYEGRDVYGCISVTANNVTIRNCRVRGTADGSYWSASAGALINCRGTTGTVIDRCHLEQDVCTWFGYAIYAGAVTVNRCHIRATVDGVHIRDGGNVAITGNYMHDFTFSDQSTDQASSNPPYWTHNDGVQLRMGGDGTVLVKGNSFEWYPGMAPTDAAYLAMTSTQKALVAPDVKFTRNAVLDTGVSGSYFPHTVVSARTGRYVWGCAVTISPDFGAYPSSGMSIESNWIEGGTALFQANYATAFSPGRIVNNRCGNDQYRYTVGNDNSFYGLRWNPAITITDYSGNVWDDVATVDAAKRGTAMTTAAGGGITIG